MVSMKKSRMKQIIQEEVAKFGKALLEESRKAKEDTEELFLLRKATKMLLEGKKTEDQRVIPHLKGVIKYLEKSTEKKKTLSESIQREEEEILPANTKEKFDKILEEKKISKTISYPLIKEAVAKTGGNLFQMVKYLESKNIAVDSRTNQVLLKEEFTKKI
jgi:hypothetical protein